MSLHIKVWSDYICPFCVIAEKPLLEATTGEDVTFEWMPFELRPQSMPQLLPTDPYLLTSWNRTVMPLAKRVGVQMNYPEINPWPYTTLAHEGYQFAHAHGRGHDYATRVGPVFFDDNRDIGDVAVLTEVAAELGMHPGRFREALMTGAYREANESALAQADKYRITSVPTVVINDSQRVEGVLHVSQLRTAIEAAKAESSSDGDGWGATCGIDGC